MIHHQRRSFIVNKNVISELNIGGRSIAYLSKLLQPMSSIFLLPIPLRMELGRHGSRVSTSTRFGRPFGIKNIPAFRKTITASIKENNG